MIEEEKNKKTGRTVKGRRKKEIKAITGEKKTAWQTIIISELASQRAWACSLLAQFRRGLPQPLLHWPRRLPRPPPGNICGCRTMTDLSSSAHLLFLLPGRCWPPPLTADAALPWIRPRRLVASYWAATTVHCKPTDIITISEGKGS